MRFNTEDDSGCVSLGLNRISHPFLEALDCFEHRELVGWIICIEEPGCWELGRQSLGKKCWPRHES